MKRITIAFVLGFMITLLAGCNQNAQSSVSGNGGPLPPDDILTFHNRDNGRTLSIGDGMEQVKEATGGQETHVFDFEGDGVHRATYEDAEGLWVDLLEEKVVALSVFESDDEPASNWEISSGVRLGMTKQEVLALYDGNDKKSEGMQGGVLLAYDQEKNPIDFDPAAHYIITISFDDEERVEYIGIQYNF